MLRRIAIWLLLAAGVLAMLAAAGALVLLRTPPGQDFLLSIALPRLAKEAGFGIEIAKARGAWPAHLELAGVRLSDAKGVWFEAERLTIAWRPALALSNRYVFDAVGIQGGNLLREPETGSATPRQPRRYPALKFGAITAKGFRLGEPVIGQALAIDLRGALELAADGKVDSPLAIDAAARELLSRGAARLTGERVRLSARVRGTAGQRYIFEALQAESERVALAGSLTYEVATRDISAKLAGTLSAAIAAKIDPRAHAPGPVEVTLTTHGPWKALAIDLAARLPALTFEAHEIAPSMLAASLTLSRAPRELKGPVSIVFEDAAAPRDHSRIDGGFFWDRGSRIRLEYVNAHYRGARVSGMVDLDAAQESADARLAFNVPELADLPLPLRASGTVLGAAAILYGKSTRIDAQIASPAIEIEGISIAGLAALSKGTPDGFSATLSAQSIARSGAPRAVDVAASADIAWSDGTTRLTINRLSATVAKMPVALATPAALSFGSGEITLAETNVRWGDGNLRAQGAIGGEIVASLKASSVDLLFAPYLVSGEIAVNTGQAEAGTLALSLTPSAGESLNLRADITGRWANERLTLEGAIAGYGTDAAFGRIEPVRVSLPLALVKHGEAFALRTTGAIDGRIQYAGTIDRFVPLFPLPEQAISGDADIDIAISGSLEKPQLAGRAAIINGSYEHTGVGIYLDRMNISADGTASGGLAVRGTASDRRGGNGMPITLAGRIGFQPQPNVTASLTLDRARVLHTANIDADVSGALKLEGALQRAALSGYIDINTAEFQIPKSLPPDIVGIRVVDVSRGGIAAEAARATIAEFPIDVRITARQQVFVRGRGLDSEWASRLHAMGTTRDPRLDGTLTLRRGRFDFSGRPFTLTSGLVQFVPSRTADPDLAIEASNQVASGTVAIIAVSGRASKPVIRLTSDPPLPQDDVMALILFGRPAERLSALQAVQVASAIATLTGTSPFGGGGTGLLDRARSTLGLDLLDVSVGGEDGSSVTVGKYLRRGVFVSASPGIGDKPGSVSAEVELSRSVSVETRIGQDAQESVGISWKHDY